MRLQRAFLVLSLIFTLGIRAYGMTDEAGTLPDTTIVKEGWVKQLFRNGFHINDPSINYPRFARFCLNLYNWGDRTFNSYDTTYVVSTGMNWKAMIKNHNVMESYLLLFPDQEVVRLFTYPYSDLGVSLNFMAVGLSYTFNTRKLLFNSESTHNNFDFSFTCSRFAANLYYDNASGGARIVKFLNYKPVEHRHMRFNNIDRSAFYVDGYWFFNHSRYSQAAAFCFSKYQLKSAGSWLAGISYLNQDIKLDFTSLPQEMQDLLPMDDRKLRFHYKDYSIIGGYAYNFVLKPRKWLFNITALPSVGYRHSYADASVSRREMISTGIKGMFSLTYNHRRLFMGLSGNLITRIYITPKYTFFNTNANLSTIIGVRF